MTGKKNGVVTQILKQKPRGLFTHCYGHAVSLIIVDDILRDRIFLQSIMDTTHEISKLLQYSPKCQALFKVIKANTSPDAVKLRALCPTRRTVSAETFKGILDNYGAVLELWETILNDRLDSEIRRHYWS